MAGRAFSNGAVRENNAIEREQRASSANSTRDHHSIKKKELLDKLITQLTMKLSSVLMGLATLAVVGEATLRRNLGNMDYYTGRSNKQPAVLSWWNSKGGQDARMQRVVGPRDSIGTALGGAIMSKFFDDDDDLGNMDYYTGRSNKQPAVLSWWNSKGGQDARMQRVVGPRDSIGTALGGAIMSKFFDGDDDLE
jgi:hypothetical protein